MLYVALWLREIWLGFYALLVSLDRLGNAILFGSHKQTISARMGIAIREGRCQLCRPICMILDLFDKNHCADEAADEGVQPAEPNPTPIP